MVDTAAKVALCDNPPIGELTLTDTKLYVSVLSLTNQANTKRLKCGLKSGFKLSVSGNIKIRYRQNNTNEFDH